jgi:S-adenosylmethionine decarboxylase
MTTTYPFNSVVHVPSESSLIISPHRLILKTCGTTLNLLGLPRILEIARTEAGLPVVYRCFYSRKSFMFPERQRGPHREWKEEVEYLNNRFRAGAAYTIGNMNRDHWLLYITSPDETTTFVAPVISDQQSPASVKTYHHRPPPTDYTIEILMSELAAEASSPFFARPDFDASTSSVAGLDLSRSLGISDIFPFRATKLDAYSFKPCGYSSNALIRWGPDDLGDHPGGEGYSTIHVTPEEGWSYASFECNLPLPVKRSTTPTDFPNLETVIRRVVDIFRPGKLTITLFMSCGDNNDVDEGGSKTAIETAQRAFRSALIASPREDSADRRSVDGKAYKRIDKINYDLGDYELAFATFEQIS